MYRIDINKDKVIVSYKHDMSTLNKIQDEFIDVYMDTFDFKTKYNIDLNGYDNIQFYKDNNDVRMYCSRIEENIIINWEEKLSNDDIFIAFMNVKDQILNDFLVYFLDKNNMEIVSNTIVYNIEIIRENIIKNLLIRINNAYNMLQNIDYSGHELKIDTTILSNISIKISDGSSLKFAEFTNGDMNEFELDTNDLIEIKRLYDVKSDELYDNIKDVITIAKDTDDIQVLMDINNNLFVNPETGIKYYNI